MQQFSPAFAYREKRRYVHGTDIYSAVASCLAGQGLGSSGGPFSMNLRKVSRNQLDILVSAAREQLQRPERTVADFMLHDAAGPIMGVLFETDRIVSDILPFPEQRLIEAATMDGTDNKLPGGPHAFTPIQGVVALCKALHQTHRPVAQPKQWMFTRLSISRLLPSDLSDGIEMRLGPAGAISRATFSCGPASGEIYFSRVAL